jgi:hypothetical protein
MDVSVAAADVASVQLEVVTRLISEARFAMLVTIDERGD